MAITIPETEPLEFYAGETVISRIRRGEKQC